MTRECVSFRLEVRGSNPYSKSGNNGRGKAATLVRKCETSLSICSAQPPTATKVTEKSHILSAKLPNTVITVLDRIKKTTLRGDHVRPRPCVIYRLQRMSDFREIRALNKPYIISLSQHGILRPQDKHGRGVLEIRREDANATIYEMLLTVSDGLLQTKRTSHIKTT